MLGTSERDLDGSNLPAFLTTLEAFLLLPDFNYIGVGGGGGDYFHYSYIVLAAPCLSFKQVIAITRSTQTQEAPWRF